MDKKIKTLDIFIKLSLIIFVITSFSYIYLAVSEKITNKIDVKILNHNKIDDKNIISKIIPNQEILDHITLNETKINFLSVWEPFYVYLKKEKMQYPGNKQVIVEYNEKWTYSCKKYYSLKDKRINKDKLYKINVYAKNNKIQGIIVKAKFLKNPTTNEKVKPIDQNILIYDKKLILNDIVKNDIYKTKFWNFLKNIANKNITETPELKIAKTPNNTSTILVKNNKVNILKIKIFNKINLLYASIISLFIFVTLLIYKIFIFNKIEHTEEKENDTIDISYKNSYSASELYYAILSNNTKKALKLIKKGSDINEIDKDGDSLLLIAVYKNNVEITKKLIEKGIDVKHLNNHGITALSYAVESNLIDIIKLFVD